MLMGRRRSSEYTERAMSVLVRESDDCITSNGIQNNS
jgi:hypothetical protein